MAGAHQNSTASPHQERDTNVFDEESTGPVAGTQPFWLQHGAGADRECASAFPEYSLIAFASKSGFQLDARIAVPPQSVTLVSQG